MPSKKTKTTVRVDRLRKLADFLDALPRSHFDFARVIGKVAPTKANECGTVGCAIGWCPTVFPRLCKAEPLPAAPGRLRVRINGRRLRCSYSSGFSEAGIAIFGLSPSDVQGLFVPNRPSPADGKSLPDQATPKQVARRIRTYAAWCERTGVRA